MQNILFSDILIALIGVHQYMLHLASSVKVLICSEFSHNNEVNYLGLTRCMKNILQVKYSIFPCDEVLQFARVS